MDTRRRQLLHMVKTMLGLAILFLTIALVAGATGFLGIAGAAVGMAKIIFVLFVILLVISLFFGRRAPV